jgi:hypothetical protein
MGRDVGLSFDAGDRGIRELSIAGAEPFADSDGTSAPILRTTTRREGRAPID